MVNQAKVAPCPDGTSDGPREMPPGAVARNMADLGHDVLTLAELQTKLLAADCREAARRVAVPIVLGTTGLVLSLCALPMLMVAIAYVFIEALDWPHWAGFLLTFGIGMILSGILLLVAYSRLKICLTPFDRSRQELSQNVRWIKAVLRHRGSRGVPRC